MKKVILLLAIFTISFTTNLFSQDIMTMKNGDEIKIKVLEIFPDVVKYKKWDNLDGPSYSEYKVNVFMIKYQNGTKDLFNLQANTQAQPVQISNDEIKKNDAVTIVEKFFSNGFKTSNVKIYNMLGFKKTNGIMRNIFGQSVYEIDFELTIQFVRDAWMKGNNMEGYWRNDFQAYTSKPDLYASGQQYLYEVKFFPMGTTYKINGTAMMENTDNGYKLKKHELKTFTNLGVRSVQNEYAQNNTDQQKTVAPVIKIINSPVEYKVFKGYLSSGSLNTVIKISDIRISDELNNISEAQTKILESISKMRRLEKPNWESNITADTLLLEISADFSYRNYSSSSLASYFADCNLRLKLLNSKKSEVVYNNNYKLSNYKLLSNGFGSALDANKNLIAANDFNQSLSQFITGNFPLTGEIIEVTEKRKSEAKTVKINIGRSSGIFVGYNFNISDYNSTNNDIKVVEAFDNYCLCKVNENAKRIYEDIALGKKLKIVTLYKP